MALERMAETSTQNLIDAIESSKKQPLHRLIFGLGIRHTGANVSQILANKFGDIDSIKAATIEELESVPEIGPIIAEELTSFFSNPENHEMIERLRTYGLKFEQEKTSEENIPPGTEIFMGKTCVLTGSLTHLSRQDASEELRKRGGKVSSSVSKNTDFVIVGDNPGSKYEKAMKFGITIIREDDFLKLCGK